MNKDQIIQEAQTYLSGDKTIEETAKNLNISKRTLQLHLGKLDIIDPELHKLVLEKKESMQIKGRVKGGTIGKATPSYTKEEAEYVANEMIKNGYTYENASKRLGIPKSTIYEMVHSNFIDKELKDKLEVVAIANQKGLTVDELINKNRRGRK